MRYHQYCPPYFLLLTCWLLTACQPNDADLRDVVIPGDAPPSAFTKLVRDSTSEVLLASHGDVSLRLSFRATPGASAELIFQNKHVLRLPEVRIPDAAPRLDAEVSADSWHDLEVAFTAGTDNQPALFSAVYLDGMVIYYQHELTDGDTEPGPLRFRVTAGTVELTDLAYTEASGTPSSVSADGTVTLNIPQLRYAYYHLPQNGATIPAPNTTEPAATGYTGRFDLNGIRDRGRDYAVRFTGNFLAPTAGEYEFATYGPSYQQLYVDGELLFDKSGEPRQYDGKGTVQLDAGPHELRLDVVQNHGWNKLDVTVRPPEATERQFLNSMEEGKNIASPAATDPTELKTDDRPYLLRSFVYFPTPRPYAEATKRTHALSVGEGDGPHYTVDLQTGALLQVWRGRFADVHEMWDGRGEPQVMRPLGAALAFDGSPLVADLPAIDSPWPDSLTEDSDFHHERYELDAAGRPTFHYEADGHQFTDAITPTATGLERTITHRGGEGTRYVQLANARSIEAVTPGVFDLRGPGLRLTTYAGDIRGANAGLIRQTSPTRQRLLISLAPGESVRYTLEW